MRNLVRSAASLVFVMSVVSEPPTVKPRAASETRKTAQPATTRHGWRVAKRASRSGESAFMVYLPRGRRPHAASRGSTPRMRTAPPPHAPKTAGARPGLSAEAAGVRGVGGRNVGAKLSRGQPVLLVPLPRLEDLDCALVRERDQQRPRKPTISALKAEGKACRVLEREVGPGGTERLKVEQKGEFRFLLFAQAMTVVVAIDHEPMRVADAKAVSFDLGFLILFLGLSFLQRLIPYVFG